MHKCGRISRISLSKISAKYTVDMATAAVYYLLITMVIIVSAGMCQIFAVMLMLRFMIVRDSISV